MKKLLLFSLLFTTVFTIRAQDEIRESSYVLGGYFNFTHDKNSYGPPSVSNGRISGRQLTRDDIKTTQLSISPYLGRELNPHIIVGLDLDFVFSSSAYYSFDTWNELTRIETDATQVGVGVFGRYIFNPAQKLNFYLQPSVSYNWLTQNLESESIPKQKSTSNYLGAKIDLGVQYQVNERFRLLLQSGGLKYAIGTYKSGPIEEDFNTFGANLNLTSIRFGVEMKF